MGQSWAAMCILFKSLVLFEDVLTKWWGGGLATWGTYSRLSIFGDSHDPNSHKALAFLQSSTVRSGFLP